MEIEPSVLHSLRKAVEAMPDDVPLRVHLATMLMSAGLRDEAVRQAGAVLQREPGNHAVLALFQQPGQPPGQEQAQPQGSGYDWSRGESEVQDLPPMSISGGPDDFRACAGGSALAPRVQELA